MKLLGREPALVLGAVNALIMVIGSVGLGLFNGEQAGLLIIVINALAGAATAIVTRPVGPAAFTAVISSLLAFLAAYQIEIPGPTVAAINAGVYPILAFLTRGEVSPIATAVTKASNDPTPEAAVSTGPTP